MARFVEADGDGYLVAGRKGPGDGRVRSALPSELQGWPGGIKQGDRIIQVDDKTSDQISPDQLADLLRGTEGSLVTVVLKDSQRDLPRYMNTIAKVRLRGPLRPHSAGM